jgi:thiamine kinase-like enzyme
MTFWTYCEPVVSEISAAEYASALGRLHAGMRRLDFVAPHFTDRVEEAEQLVADHAQTPTLVEADRELLRETLANLKRAVVDRNAAEQLLHGEPHPGNVLATKNGLLFVDLETCCRGPVEFDLAHAPDEVAEQYPGIDRDLLWNCRILVLAMITAWRWDRSDQLPDGRRRAAEWIGEIREALGR